MVTAADDLYGRLKESAALCDGVALNAKVLDTLIQGSYVKVLAYNSAWALVKTESGVQGYVRVSCLEPVHSARMPEDAGTAETDADGGQVVWLKTPRTMQVSAVTIYTRFIFTP